MVRSILASIALLSVLASARAQDGRAGLLLGAGSIAPGYIPAQELSTSYLIGTLSYYMEDRISIQGRGAWYQPSDEAATVLNQHHSLSVGPLYHWGKERLDIHTGPEVGTTFTRLAGGGPSDAALPMRVLPLMAWNGGITYFVWDHFHFFLDLRYQYARYVGSPTGTVGLGEMTFAGGLGFHLNTRR